MSIPEMSAPIVFATPCHRYRVELQKTESEQPHLCRSLAEVYDLLREQHISRAVLAQRTSYDEMIGQPAEEGVSYLTLPVPAP